MTRAYHCGKCRQPGHNARACPEQPNAERAAKRDASRQAVATALAKYHGNYRRAGAALGVTRQRVGQLVAEHGLKGLAATLRFAASPTPAERKQRSNVVARESANARRRRWLAEGRCPFSGCERTDGHTLCPKHRSYAAASDRKRYNRRVANGACPRCGRPAAAGRKHCVSCLAAAATYNRSRS